MAELNAIIHQPARLRIMAALMAADGDGALDFSSLARLLKLTDGNLGAHLQTLEEAGYLKVEKSFVKRKPRTQLSLTRKGRYEFEEHVAALKQVLAKSI